MKNSLKKSLKKSQYDQQIQAAIDQVRRTRGTPQEDAAFLNYREIMDWAERDSDTRRPGSGGPLNRLGNNTPRPLSTTRSLASKGSATPPVPSFYNLPASRIEYHRGKWWVIDGLGRERSYATRQQAEEAAAKPTKRLEHGRSKMGPNNRLRRK